MDSQSSIKSVLRPNLPKRVKINVHLLESELQEFKLIAKRHDLKFSGLVRAALRAFKSTLSLSKEGGHHQ